MSQSAPHRNGRSRRNLLAVAAAITAGSKPVALFSLTSPQKGDLWRPPSCGCSNAWSKPMPDLSDQTQRSSMSTNR